MTRRPALLLVLTCGLAALAVLAPPAPAQDPVGLRSIRPSATDARITGPFWAHHVIAPQSAHRNQLLVFLPGSGAGPLGYDEVLGVAARFGYHAIGLTYDNGATAGSRCGNRLDCYGPLHQRVFDGTGGSPEATTEPVNGVEHRLAALLAHLARAYPQEGWGAYVSGGLPVWGRIVVGGHSQGASAAAWAGKARVVAGVLMMSGPADGDTSNRPATWLTSGHRTPSSRYVGLTNSRDPWFLRDLAAWRALGVAGASAPVSVDGGVRGTPALHALVTSERGRGLGLLVAHNETVVDPVTPLCGTAPALGPVWRAMIGLANGGTGPVRPAC